jgi:hypothetical protein
MVYSSPGSAQRSAWRSRMSTRKTAGVGAAAPSTPAERLALWCDRLPSPGPAEMLRTSRYKASAIWTWKSWRAALGKKPSGGHWNSGIAVLRNNGLIEAEPAPAEAEPAPAEAGVGATGLPRSSGIASGT